MKKLHASFVLVSAVLVLSGCTLFGSSLKVIPATGQGVHLEELMPVDPFMVFTYNPTDAQQGDLLRTNLEKITAVANKYNQDYVNGLTQFFNTLPKDALMVSLMEKEKALGANAFPAAPQISVSIKFPPAASEQSDPIMGVFIGGFSESQIQAQRSILKDILTGVTPQRDTADVLYIPSSNGKKLQVGVIKDVVFLTGSSEQATEIIERFENTKIQTLADNTLFKDAIKELPNQFAGYVFYDTNAIWDRMGDGTEDVPALKLPFPKTGMSVFSASGTGINVSTLQPFTDETKKSAYYKNMKEGDIGLYKKVPTTDAILYEEGVGLGGVIEDMLVAGEVADEDLKNIKDASGIDVRGDIIPLLNGPFAFVMQNSPSGAIPAFSFYVDAAQHAESAQRIETTLDVTLDSLISFAKMSIASKDPMQSVLEKHALDSAVGQGAVLTFHANRLKDTPTELEGIISALVPAQVEVTYGLTKDNVFFFSTYTGVEKLLGTSNAALTSQPLFKMFLNNAKIEKSVVYLDPAALGKTIQRFVDVFSTIEPMDEATKSGLALVQEYLGLVKGVFSAGSLTSDGIRSESFIGL
ncbi:hypothetical protein KBD59_05185 [Candidatus Gracilibacteria bacterium]|nr:hypothetical protein [Candidatus Gracilibacteria bacterium]